MSKISKISEIFLEFFKNYPRKFLFLFILLLLEGVIAASTVLSIIPLADYLLDPTFSNPSRVTRFVLDFFSSLGVKVDFWLVGFIFIGFNILKGVFKVAIRYAILRIKYSVLRGLINHSLTKFFGARWEFFASSDKGRLLNTLNKEIPKIGDTLGQLATQMSSIVQFAIYIIVPIWLNAYMTLTALVLTFCFGLPFLFFNRLSYRLGKLNTETSNIELGILSEIFQSARIILGFGRQAYSKLKYLEAFDAHINATLKSQTLTEAVPGLFAPMGMLAAVIALGLSLQQQGQVSELAAVMWSLLSAMPILSALLQTHVNISNFIPSFEQLQSERNRAYGLREIEGEKVFDKLNNCISLRNVSFSYPSRNKTISNVNINLYRGKMTALVGKSGSGKSTITDLILGLLAPDFGMVLIDDIPFSDWKQNTFREKVGYVPQEPILFHTSIRENLLWALDTASESDLWDALKLSNAEQFVKGLPEGIDTIVGDRGVRMSGGQRQRIALARGLLRKPELLILDEATSSLDTESEKLIQKSIENLAHKMTILVIAHRLTTIIKADKLYVMHDGEIVEEGTYKELSLQSNTMLYSMLNNQNNNN